MLQQSVEIPQYSTILTAQVQNEIICLWVEHYQQSDLYKKQVYIVGTGDEIPAGASKYINTVQIREFVFHIYS